MNQFASPTRVFYNTIQQDDIEKQVKNARPEMLSQLNLGQLLPYPVENQFRLLHGDPLNMKYESEKLRAPVEADTEYWSQYPIPYTLNITNNKLVDVSGTLYRNADLPVIAKRM